MLTIVDVTNRNLRSENNLYNNIHFAAATCVNDDKKYRRWRVKKIQPKTFIVIKNNNNNHNNKNK